ncbi:hypothetical protein WL02_02225 [Burkholderia ubonensis]|nr:hypothetical protein WL02_02225 [Burkholderia ubonensis]
MKRDPEGSFVLASDACARNSRADALIDRIKAMFVPNPADELGPTDEPESQYRFGYNTALEDVLSAIAASPAEPPAAAPADAREGLTADQRAAVEFALGACAGHRAGEPHVAALESLLAVRHCQPNAEGVNEDAAGAGEARS